VHGILTASKQARKARLCEELLAVVLAAVRSTADGNSTAVYVSERLFGNFCSDRTRLRRDDAALNKH